MDFWNELQRPIQPQNHVWQHCWNQLTEVAEHSYLQQQHYCIKQSIALAVWHQSCLSSTSPSRCFLGMAQAYMINKQCVTTQRRTARVSQLDSLRFAQLYTNVVQQAYLIRTRPYSLLLFPTFCGVSHTQERLEPHLMICQKTTMPMFLQPTLLLLNCVMNIIPSWSNFVYFGKVLLLEGLEPPSTPISQPLGIPSMLYFLLSL